MRANETRKQIVGCTHKHGQVFHARTNRFDPDAAEFLHWQCNDCPLQIPLVDLRRMPPRDLFWFTRGVKTYSKEWEADYKSALTAAREMDDEDRAMGQPDEDTHGNTGSSGHEPSG